MAGVSVKKVGLASLVTVLCVLGTLATAGKATVVFEQTFGGSGSGPGQFGNGFSGPGGIAFSEFNQHVYIADPAQQRVQEFEADGDFFAMWGQGVNQTTGGNRCTAASGDTCKAGQTGGVGGAFNTPRGVAVNQTTGDVYVQDAGNNRVQKFGADGTFLLTWGKGVDFTTGADLCTAASGDVCKPGALSGDPSTTPKTPTANGAFRGWESANGDGIATDGDGFVYVTDPKAVPFPRVQKFDPNGGFVAQIASPNENFFDRGLFNPSALDVDSEGNAYVLDGSVKGFEASDFTPTGTTAGYERIYGESSNFQGPRQIAVDPTNDFLFVGVPAERSCPGGDPSSYYIQEFHPNGQMVDCTTTPDLSNGEVEAGMSVSLDHKLYAGEKASGEVHVFAAPVATPPSIDPPKASEITSLSARVNTEIEANLSDTTYHLEYGPQPCSNVPNPCASTSQSGSIGAAYFPTVIGPQLEGLEPGTTYYYRVVATNAAGTTAGVDRVFSTFPSPEFDPSCGNNLARQQTGAAFLLDCRAYELVSAQDTGGYNIESDLVPGQSGFGGYPYANDKLLYAVFNGGLKGIGKPTNRGPDPYVASRDAANGRWTTEYVGIPADVPSLAPFSSTVASASKDLEAFAFGGPDICDPCFEDESAGMPVRRHGDLLEQGMAGSLPVADPEPAGEVRKALSGDGTHFIFGSYQQFEPEGNTSGADVTIYDRNLETGDTQVVSTLPDGSTIQAGDEVAALDVSEDGSRILIGVLEDTDSAGNPLWQLYLHVDGSPGSVALTEGASSGVGYAGMDEDGSTVYFTSADPLGDDGDAGSVDLFGASANGADADVELISAGGETDSCDPAGNSYNPEDWNAVPGGPSDCSVVAVGGGGGVAKGGGGIYFLSPEQLDGAGVEGAPNLYVARPGSPPEFVATLESGANEPLKPAAHVFDRSFGSFVHPEGAAIDPVTGAAYVLDTGATVQSAGAFLQKFSPSGSVDASFGDDGKIDGSDSPTGAWRALGEGQFLGTEHGVPNSIAVDTNPASPNYRDIWVVDLTSSTAQRYGSDGTFEDSFSLGSNSFPSAIAINPVDGNLYVNSLFTGVSVWTPAGVSVAPTVVQTVQFSLVDMAVDTAGNIYIANDGTTKVYDAAGVLVKTLDANTKYGVDIDPTDGHVYVDRGDRVIEYDAAGNQVGDPLGLGVVSKSVGVAAYGGRVTITNEGSGNAVSYTEPITPPDRSYDSPLVIHSVREAERRFSSDFQTSPSGDHAVFSSVLPLTGFASDGHYELFRYEAGQDLACVSCAPTLAPPTTDATMASNGLSITDDGQVFFTSGEPLVLRDDNSKKDAYEWSDGAIELVSTGKSSFDSGLLTVSADGVDAFFYTREKLAVKDDNGNLMRIYDARKDGGFFVVPPPPPCAASDECHGPSSKAAPPADLGSLEGEGRNAAPGPSCKAAALTKRARRLAARAKQLREAGEQAKARKAQAKAKRIARAARKCRNEAGGTSR